MRKMFAVLVAMIVIFASTTPATAGPVREEDHGSVSISYLNGGFMNATKSFDGRYGIRTDLAGAQFKLDVKVSDKLSVQGQYEEIVGQNPRKFGDDFVNPYEYADNVKSARSRFLRAGIGIKIPKTGGLRGLVGFAHDERTTRREFQYYDQWNNLLQAREFEEIVLNGEFVGASDNFKVARGLRVDVSGIVYPHMSNNQHFRSNTGGGTNYQSQSKSIGMEFAVGLDYAVARNVSVGGGYQYRRFSKEVGTIDFPMTDVRETKNFLTTVKFRF